MSDERKVINKSNKVRILYAQIFKKINNLNPDFMNNILKTKGRNESASEKYKLNLGTLQ